MGALEWSRKNAAALVSTLGGVSIQALIEFSKDEKAKAAVAATIGGVGVAALGPIGLVAGALASIGTNLLSNCLERRREAQEALQKFLTNEHIARLQAMAVQQALLEFAGTCKDTKDQQGWVERIVTLANTAEQWWLTAVNDPERNDVEVFRDDAVVAELTHQLTAEKPRRTTVDLWRSLLVAENMRFDRRDKLPELALDAAADHLAAHYGAKWKNALKHDFATDGRAFAAVSLHFFAEILAGVKENSTDLKEVKGGMEEVKRMVVELNSAATKLQTVTDLSNDLRNTVNEAQGLLATVSKQLAEIKEQVAVEGEKARAHTSAVGQDIKDHVSAELEKLRHDLSRADALTNERIAAHLREGADKLFQERIVAATATLGGEELVAALNAEKVGHQRRLQRIEEVLISIAGIQAAGDGSPIMREMLRILATQDVDRAIAYVDTQRQQLLTGTDQLMAMLQEQLQPLLKAAELLETQGRYADAEVRYKEVLTRMPTWSEARYGLYCLLITWCDDLEIHGTVADRKPKLQEAVTIAEQRSLDAPHNAQAQRNLSISYNKLGDLLRQEGKGAEARKAYEEDLRISQKLAQEDPHNAQAQRDLSISYERLGDLLIQEGRGAEAHKVYDDGLAISQKLAQEDPHNAQAQRDLSVSYNKLGDLLRQEGKGAEARKAYEDGLAIRQKLAQEDPHNAQAQRDLSVSYIKLGELLRQEGKGAEAHKAYEDGLAIRQKLAQEDPHNAQAQRDLSISYERLGDLLRQEGKGGEARKAYEEDLRISQKLAQEDPHNAQAQRDLWVSYNKLGDLQLQEGKGAEAVSYTHLTLPTSDLV